MRNTHASIEESLERVEMIQEICLRSNKKMVLYVSMGFGNPYGDPRNVDIVSRWVEKLVGLGIEIFQLSDTIGVASPQSISYLFGQLIPAHPNVEIGAHFHTTPDSWKEKVETAYENGCRRFDGAIKGFGGCPMAKDDLTGNMPMENLIQFMSDREESSGVDESIFQEAMKQAYTVFPL